jgi:hypothetical protein
MSSIGRLVHELNNALAHASGLAEIVRHDLGDGHGSADDMDELRSALRRAAETAVQIGTTAKESSE